VEACRGDGRLTARLDEDGRDTFVTVPPKPTKERGVGSVREETPGDDAVRFPNETAPARTRAGGGESDRAVAIAPSRVAQGDTKTLSKI